MKQLLGCIVWLVQLQVKDRIWTIPRIISMRQKSPTRMANTSRLMAFYPKPPNFPKICEEYGIKFYWRKCRHDQSKWAISATAKATMRKAGVPTILVQERNLVIIEEGIKIATENGLSCSFWKLRLVVVVRYAYVQGRNWIKEGRGMMPEMESLAHHWKHALYLENM